MNEQLLVPLNKLESCLDILTRSLTTTNSYAAAPKAAQDLVVADNEYRRALLTLKQHQDNFQKIEHLRNEAEALQNNLKTTIRQCVDFRTRLGSIDPKILEPESNSDEEVAEVDYETLLTLGARIGQANAAENHRAERKANEEYHQKQKAAKSQTNGTVRITTATQQTEVASEASQDTADQAKSQRMKDIEADLAMKAEGYRNYHYAPFPSGDQLRQGALGRLQLIREQQGEQALDDEVERIVRLSEFGEDIRKKEEPINVPPEGDQDLARQVSRSQVQPRPRPAAAPRERKQLDLDLPSDDDD
ncbi:hypothetical protein BT93_L0372 [Corymbia citriodora subsp. variegata]|uniref:Mediator of RNA polymerase II transcription subunit 4 n=1 Tax=Corymbia citriodora subsp. variegata TaxID=360336 RepID=A0A8T0CIA4_CORYI|nr:hypothetical protein BT93_L0372 [Corymbia citriodora subsp. variegata]